MLLCVLCIYSKENVVVVVISFTIVVVDISGLDFSGKLLTSKVMRRKHLFVLFCLRGSTL